MKQLKEDDWVGLGTSITIHLVVLIFFALVNVAASEEQPIGYIEVDFGPLSEGRPVQRAAETKPAPVERPPEPEPEVQPEEEASPPPEEVKPVELPDQPEEVIDPEQVDAPEAETIAPEAESNPAQPEDPKPEREVPVIRPLGGGATDGTVGPTEGDEGEGTEERKTAPFDIEGLNRTAVRTTLPPPSNDTGATIRVRITVDPQGKIKRRILMSKGNAKLEQGVMDALSRWQFNPLPTNAPQEDQTGIVTFRFVVE